MMTFEDLYKMLSKGKTAKEIRCELFSSVSSDINRTYFRHDSEMDFQTMSDVLKQNGYDLEILPHMTFSFPNTNNYWRIKLNNTTISIDATQMESGRVCTQIRYFQELGSQSYPIGTNDPQKFMDSIREADERYPEVLRVWESFKKEIRKFHKIKEMSESSIDAIVKEKLRGTGFEYNLTLEPTYVLLKVKMERGRCFEIKLPHNGFSDILTEDFVEEINKVATLLNGIKYTCKIQRCGNNINWFKSE